MKSTKAEVEEAILTVAESLNMKDTASYLLGYTGIDGTIKEIAYTLFVENPSWEYKSIDAVFKSFKIMREYAQELRKNGEVVFENDPDWRIGAFYITTDFRVFLYGDLQDGPTCIGICGDEKEARAILYKRLEASCIEFRHIEGFPYYKPITK